jgi:hypothetical protein
MDKAPRRITRQVRRRRVLIALVLAVLGLPAIGYGVLALQTSHAPAPAALRARPAASRGPAGPIGGAWAVSVERGDFVGYRVREKLGPLPAPDDAVGRTRVVRGRMVIVSGRIASARITADLSTLTSDAAPRDGALRDQGLESGTYPNGTFTLARPIPIGHPGRGQVMRRRVSGRLTLHGVTRTVPIAMSMRWNGDSVEVAGSTVIRLADFRMSIAQRLGLRIADRGTMEFELTFRRPAEAKAPPAASAVPAGGPPPDQSASPDRRELAREPISRRSGRLLVIAGPPDDLTDAYSLDADGSHATAIAPKLPKNSAESPSVLSLAAEPGGRTALISRMLVPPQGDPRPPRIYRLAIATRALEPLTPAGIRAELPAASPRGDLIAYARGGSTPDQLRLYVARRDGSGARALPLVGSSDDAPAWSPDGRRIAFTCFAADDDICVVKADGSGARRLSRGTSYDSQPSWSPNGRRLAFSRDGDIWTMNAHGGGMRRLTRGAATRDTGPAWSPDGRTIAFIRADAKPDSTFAGPGRVMLMSAAGGGLVRVRTRLPSVQLVAWR